MLMPVSVTSSVDSLTVSTSWRPSEFTPTLRVVITTWLKPLLKKLKHSSEINMLLRVLPVVALPPLCFDMWAEAFASRPSGCCCYCCGSRCSVRDSPRSYRLPASTGNLGQWCHARGDDKTVQDRGQRLQLLSAPQTGRLICSHFVLAFSEVSPLNCRRQKPLESHSSSAQGAGRNINIMNTDWGCAQAGRCILTRNLTCLVNPRKPGLTVLTRRQRKWESECFAVWWKRTAGICPVSHLQNTVSLFF